MHASRFFCADYGSRAGASDSFTQRVFGIDKAARVGIIYLKPKLHFRYAKRMHDDDRYRNITEPPKP